MANSVVKAIELLSSREGYYFPLIKAKIFKDIEGISNNIPLSQLILEHKNGIWGENYLEGGKEVKILRSPDIRHGFIDVNNAEKRYININDYNKHKLTFGDILVIKSNGSQDLVGKSQLFDITKEDIISSNFILRLRPNLEKVDPYYLDLFLKSPQALMWRFKNQTTTTGLRNLKTKEYLATLIPIPDLEIQKTIVDFYNDCTKGKFEYNAVLDYHEYKKIYSLINNFDLLNKNIKKQQKCILKMKSSILQDAIQGKLVPQNENDEPASVLLEKTKKTKEHLIKEKKIKKEKAFLQITNEEKPFELPKGWEWVRFSDIGELARGKSKHRPRNDKKLFENGVYPFIQTGDVSKSELYIDSYNTMYSEFGLAQSWLWDKGTLCITIAANIAETAILNIKACFPDSVVGFTPFAPIPLEHNMYFYYFINVTKKKLEEFAPATAQKNINLSILNEVVIPLPPLNEQKRIIEKVTHLMLLCDELKANIEQSKHETEKLLKAILQEAFTEKEEILN